MTTELAVVDIEPEKETYEQRHTRELAGYRKAMEANPNFRIFRGLVKQTTVNPLTLLLVVQNLTQNVYASADLLEVLIADVAYS
jgi:hypothetical protein